jgi:hypothetical protein
VLGGSVLSIAGTGELSTAASPTVASVAVLAL